MHSYIKKYKFKAKFSQFLIESGTQKAVNNDYFDKVTTFLKLCKRILMIIVLDISPFDRTIYSTETTNKVYPSLHYQQPLAGRSFICTELEYHFIQNINHLH